MIRKLAIGVATVSLAAAGIVATGGGVATAASPHLSSITSANVSCNITAKAKLDPKLKNNWVQADHQSDPNAGGYGAVIGALPDTQFAQLGGTSTTTAKSKGACTGTVTGPEGTMTATKVKVTLGTTTQAVDNPPLNNNGGSTCTGLLAGTAGEDVAATYTSIVQLKGSGAKLATFSIVGSGVAPAGLGFAVTGGTADGVGAGATGVSQANVDLDTIVAVTEGPPTSAAPKPVGKCQPTLKLKTKKGVPTASLKQPKGLNKLTIGSGTFDLTK